LGWVEIADSSDDTKAGVSAALMLVSLIPHGVAMWVVVFTEQKRRSFGFGASLVGTYLATTMFFTFLGYLSAGLLLGKWG